MTQQRQIHKRRHHRRGPVKRFMLVAGPFLLLAVAFGLSAGVVEIVEHAPMPRDMPTLAEERAMLPPDPIESLATGAARMRLASLPGELLAGGDYGYLDPASAGAISGDLDSDPRSDLRFAISDRPLLLPDETFGSSADAIDWHPRQDLR